MTSQQQKQLKNIIKRMGQIQRAISEDGQPASPGQLEELVQLGRKYAAVVSDIKNYSETA